jgi:CHAT domain-containing protein
LKSNRPDKRASVVSLALFLFLLCGFAAAGCYSHSRHGQRHLTDDPTIKEEMKKADRMGEFKAARRYDRWLGLLRDEEAAARQQRDAVKLAYVLNEMADAYCYLVDYDHARTKNNEAADQCQKLAGKEKGGSLYVQLPLIAQGSGSPLRVQHPDYIRDYRNLDLDALAENIAKRGDDIRQRLGKKSEAATMSPVEAAKLAAQYETVLRTKKMPADQRIDYLYRIAWLKLLANPQSPAGAGVLEEALAADGNSAGALADGDHPEKLFTRLSVAQSLKMFGAAADAELAAGRPERALRDYLFVVNQSESVRAHLLHEEERLDYFGRLARTYQNVVRILAQSDPPRSFAYVEKAKARTLIEMLSAGAAPVNFGASASATFDDFYKCGETAQKQAETGGRTRGIHVDDCEAQQAKADRQFPEAFSLIRPPDFRSQDVVRMMPANAVFLSYYVLGDRLLAYVIAKGDFSLQVLPDPPAEIERLVQEYLDALEPNSQMEGTDQIDELSRRLYRALLAPLAGRLTKQVVYLSADGPALLNLPFHALRAPDGAFAADQYQFVYVDSATVLKFCLQKEKSFDRRASILALGNPALHSNKYKFETLPGAEQEVREIGAIFPGNARILLGPDATLAAFRELAGGCRFVHLATHGVTDPMDPFKSSVMLAASGTDDGALSVKDIFSLTFPQTELVALSACETQKGQVRAGAEFLGFNRAFFYAGVPNTLTTHWKIDDAAALWFIRTFYQSVHDGKSLAAAMQEAYRSTRNNPAFQHPRHWAAFRLNGSGGLK